MWVVAASKPVLEEALFRFLLTVRENRPRATSALAAERPMLSQISAAPHADLREVFGDCLNALLIEIDADVTARRPLNVPATVFGFALAVNNCLAPAGPEPDSREDGEARLNDEYTQALIATLAPAREVESALAYHAVLRETIDGLTSLSDGRAELMRALVERSPLTALYALDAHTPAALYTLAAELLPGWQLKHPLSTNVWPSDDDWLETVAALLEDERIARWVRQRWLLMPETREACRNVGLLLEALRRRGKSRAFVLEFYEAYDYFRARTRADEWQGEARFWPVLDEIEKLLRVGGTSDASIQLNRRGNEYFLKFRPLVEIVIAENGLPTDYAHLSREFIQSLRPLLAFVTEGTRQRLSFGAIAFDDAGS